MQTLNKLRLAARTLVLLTLSMLGATNIYGAPGDVLETLTISNSEATGVPSPTGYQGIATYNGYLWVVDVWSDRIYRVYPETVFDEDEVTVLNNPGDSDFNIPIPDNIPNGLPFCDNQATCRGGGSLTFARNFFWNASPVTDDIVKLDPVDGDNLETENTLDTMPFPSPLGMTFDGTHFWIVDWQSNTINKVLPEDGSVIDTIPGPSTLPACGSQPYDNVQFCARPFGIAWDGIALWVTEREEQRIYRINPANGDILTYLENPSFLNDPLGLAWDGQFLWVTNRDNDSASSIHKVDSGITPFGIMGCVEKNGIGIDGDVLLSQAAQSDQSTATDRDGCFLFADFASGVPLSVEISESGNDKKPILTLVGEDVTLIVGDSYSDPGVIATDEEDGDISSSVTAVPDILNVPTLIDTSVPGPAEGTLITYNVIDSAGNAADPITRTVYVLEVDVIPPVITLNGDNPLYVEQGSSYTEPGAVAIDARDGDISNNLTITGSVNSAVAGTYSLDYDVTDATGNTAITVTRTVVVQDTTKPSITLLGTSPLTLEKGDTYIESGATATDNIDGDISGSVAIAGSVSTNLTGTYVLTYNVSDVAGNAATTVTRTVQVQDTTAPEITLFGATDIDHELEQPFSDPGYSASDVPGEDLTGSVIITGSVDPDTTGIYTLTYNVTDAAGNAAVAQTRTINVADRTAPVLSIIGDNPLEHELGAAYTEQGATAIDAIDGDLSGAIAIAGDTVDGFLTGTYIVTYDIADAAGNAAPTQTRTVNVADTTPPLVTLLGSPIVEHELGTVYTDAGATASDNIDGDLTGIITVGGDTVNTNVAGDYILTYSVVDASGNPSSVVTRLVQVADRTIPTITILGDNPLQHEVATIFNDPGATANDNIDNDITSRIGVTGSVNAGLVGSYTLTYNVTDLSGNAATTVTRTVNVVDTGTPTITLLGDNPILHELQTPFTDPGATASDDADGDLGSVTATGSVDENTAGTYTLTYDISDSQGNPAPTLTRTVIVADRTAPVISLNGAATVQHEQGTAYTDSGATAVDIIDGDLTLAINESGTVDSNTQGTYILTYDVSDAAGNAATQVTRTVNVVDTTIPVITLLGSDPVDHEVGTVYTDAGATASDNIDGVITGNIGVTGSVNASVIGTYSLTYNVQDSSGNAAATVTRTVNVVDTGAPTITLLGSNPILHELQTPFTDPGATASDAADGDLSGSIVPTGAVDPN
ncbi:DUF5011 domain-containing protein, partial [Oleiphilus sp. HI0079]|uniref:immunoglobulin-like domain-containing protein n=3 Tax=unclassified Oleiphilus TaxID=2631174 RepID=UPI0018D432D7